MTIVYRLICLLIGYCFGMIQSAYILGKMRGIDIRDYGSGNAGTSNAIRVMGTKAGLIVFLGDMLKSLAALLITGAIFGRLTPDLVYVMKAWAFAGVVLGHDYPFYMHFKGGKGVAVMAGYVIGFHPAFLPVALLLFIVPYLKTRFISLGSLMVYGGTFVCLIIFGQLGLFAPTAQGHLIEIYLIQGLLTFMAFYRHRENLGRLMRGEERQTHLFKENSEKLKK